MSEAVTKERGRPARRRVGGVAAAVLLTVVLGGQLAFAAAAPSDATPSYAGCLKVSGGSAGNVVAVKAGTTPLRPCNNSEQAIKLSSGDITSVAAGTGLRVTSSQLGLSDGEGDVSLDLAPPYRLPQGCAEGQVVTRVGTAWGCETPPAPRAAVFGAATPVSPQPVGDDPAVLGSALVVPAGSWSIVGKAWLLSGEIGDGINLVVCRLDVTGAQARDLVWIDNEEESAEAVLLTTWTSDKPFHVTVVCKDGGRGASWANLRILATPESAVVGQLL